MENWSLPLPAIGRVGKDPGILSSALRLTAIGATYFLLALLGYQLATGPFSISPIWPAAGFALAILFTHGYRVLLALAPADILASLWVGTSLAEAGAVTAAALAGPVLGAALMHRYVEVGRETSDWQDMGHFLLIAVLAAPGVSALLGITLLLPFAGLPAGSVQGSLVTWWAGDAVGNLTVAPFLLVWPLPQRRQPVLERPYEAVFLLLLLALTNGLAFWHQAIWDLDYLKAEYLILPFLAWGAIRFGLVGAATGNLILAAAAISASLAGVGPYGTGTYLDLAALEGLILLTGATTLMLGIVVTRKERAIEEARETARLQKSLRDLNDMIDQPYVGMMLVDREGLIQFTNPAAASLMGRDLEDLLGSPLGVPLAPDRKTEIEIRRGTAEPGEAEITVNPIQWEDQALYLVNLHDVTERNRAERAVRHQALHDQLTGLPNRSHFEDRVAQFIRRDHHMNKGFALVFLDLDRFKQINDTMGHAAGDELLQVIGQRLQEGVRSNDLVARMSGDEFTILLDEISDRDVALTVAEKLLNRLFEPLLLRDQWISPRGTMGLSLFPEDGEDVETLIMRADTAMYAAKEAGRNRVNAYTPQHGVLTSRRFRLEQALRRAQSEEELFLVYQPQVCCRSGRWVGVEALLRWQDPDQGVVSPADFIPLLEETGMIREVGEWVFRQANADLSRWDAAEAQVPRVWINVSARQLEGNGLVDCLDRLIEEEGLQSQRFGLELTESGVAGNIEHSRTLLEPLRERGFRLAMDDFGTGYSALSFLRQLPFDTVKIDRDFVQDINSEPKDLQLIRAIVAMARGLEMTPVAEGVETVDQARQLQREGCDLLQGFLFARPMPAGGVPGVVAGSMPSLD